MKFPFTRLFGKSVHNNERDQGPFDLFSEEAFQDPYPLYEYLRAQGSISEVASGGYTVANYNDVLSGFQDPALQNTPSRFSVLKASNAQTHKAADYALHAIPFRDGEEHRIIRKACIHALSANPFPTFEECSILADNITRQYAGSQDCEFIRDISTPYVNHVMCKWFGLPSTDGEQLAVWSESIFRLFAPLSDRTQLDIINDDITAFRDYLAERIENSKSPTGLLNTIQQEIIHQGGNHLDVIDNAILIYMDGIENIRYGAGNVVMEVFQHSEHLKKITTSPQFAESATQEALRLHTPASIISRVAAHDTCFHGIDLKAGTPVYLLIGSANRDENTFDNANTFDPERRGKAPLLFGHGVHSCLGGNAAITMISALLCVIAQHGLKVASGNSQISYIPRFGHRWPTGIPLSK